MSIQLDINDMNPISLPEFPDALCDEQVNGNSIIGNWFEEIYSDEEWEFNDEDVTLEEDLSDGTSNPYWVNPDFKDVKIGRIGGVSCRIVTGKTYDDEDVQLNVFYRTDDGLVLAWTMDVD